MRAVEFNWLTKVDDIDYDRDNNIVRFSLSLAYESAYVDVQVTPTKQLREEIQNGRNPQYTDYVNVAQLNPTDICIVGDYDQVHAISGMPFQLTAYQFNDVNTFLYEHIMENQLWAI